jgi:hypothetical protein
MPDRPRLYRPLLGPGEGGPASAGQVAVSDLSGLVNQIYTRARPPPPPRPEEWPLWQHVGPAGEAEAEADGAEGSPKSPHWPTLGLKEPGGGAASPVRPSRDAYREPTEAVETANIRRRRQVRKVAVASLAPPYSRHTAR